ncbi:hypothetical protein EYF80_006307 [Liparis tanakae]|uniref:Uncharacterized protein n=1 Tax=Liparis tanakae TaxID=230148 RepID=A0A4Z2IZL9_9TELE|nr:hypothetical protein EYF80_006307 [Liparis tanakae]
MFVKSSPLSISVSILLFLESAAVVRWKVKPPPYWLHARSRPTSGHPAPPPPPLIQSSITSYRGSHRAPTDPPLPPPPPLDGLMTDASGRATRSHDGGVAGVAIYHQQSLSGQQARVPRGAGGHAARTYRPSSKSVLRDRREASAYLERRSVSEDKRKRMERRSG